MFMKFRIYNDRCIVCDLYYNRVNVCPQEKILFIVIAYLKKYIKVNKKWKVYLTFIKYNGIFDVK